MVPSAADLRAEIARRQMLLYELAPLVGVHPISLGRMLNERRPLSAELAQKIQRAIDGGRGGPAA